MRKPLLILAMAALAFCSTSMMILHHSRSGPAISATPTVGRISISNDVLKLGILQQGVIVSSEFKVFNVGNGILHIVRLIGSCGCLSVHIDRNTLKPGEAGIVEAKFNTTGHWRDTENDILVASDDARLPFITVRLRAYVRVGIRLDVDRIELGEGNFGDRLQPAVVNVIEDRDASAIPVSVEGDVGALDIGIRKWKAYDELRECAIEIGTRPLTAPIGTENAVLRIRAGSHVFPLNLSYRVRPIVQASPAVINLQSAKSGAGLEHVRLLSSTQDIQFNQPTALYNKCSTSLKQIGNRSADLCISSTESGADDFDVVQVRYQLSSANRAETIEIPVVLRE